MNTQERRVWPFRPQTAIIATLTILFGLVLIMVILRVTLNWPNPELEGDLLLGIFLISLLPILLMLVNTLVEQGAVVEVRGVKLDFSQAQRAEMPGITVPTNIGVPGQAVADNDTNEILDALRQAVGSESVIVDLEEGKAWWETRLLVLLAGAVRHNQPKIVVFVGTDGGKKKCFLGWATADSLLPNLLNAHPKYPVSYYASLAAARQWAMVEPTGDEHTYPPSPTWIQPGLATQYSWMAFASGLPNPFYAEQLLAAELGEKIEKQEPPRTISITRLKELFQPVLHKAHVDEASSPEDQLVAFFNNDKPYITFTQSGQFKSLVPRLSVLNTMVGTLVRKE